MEFINRHKRLFLAFGILFCFAAIIVSITGVAPTGFIGRGLSYIVVPLQRGASSATGWIGGRFYILARSAEILSENQALVEENIRLSNENARMVALYEENIRLRTIVSMRERYPQLPMIGARIIGQNPNDWQSSFNIDVGENDGVFPYMVVLGDGGVLGVIHETGPNHALVVSVMDNNFAAAARNARTEDLGTVGGDLDLRNDGLMRMRHIVDTARFLPGDEITTSAHGTVFPQGLHVGTVVSVHPSPEGLTQYAIVRPSVNLDRIDIVMVVNQLFGDATGLTAEG
ncbi:MAG: rod shape-determining protein MreC [Defluviitaleaceae bacterium]|nr:rod shape-determining protein MreC [Defluviitaleaceae bacterium]